MIHWLIFGVAGALTPLAAASLITWWQSNADQPFAWTNLLGHGELLLLSVAIAFPAIGLVAMSDAGGRARGVFGGVMAIDLGITGLFYGAVAQAARPTRPGGPSRFVHAHFVTVSSIAIFMITVLIATICVAIARTTMSTSQ